jgi:hypothetical protein
MFAHDSYQALSYCRYLALEPWIAANGFYDESQRTLSLPGTLR